MMCVMITIIIISTVYAIYCIITAYIAATFIIFTIIIIIIIVTDIRSRTTVERKSVGPSENIENVDPRFLYLKHYRRSDE